MSVNNSQNDLLEKLNTVVYNIDDSVETYVRLFSTSIYTYCKQISSDDRIIRGDLLLFNIFVYSIQ